MLAFYVAVELLISTRLPFYLRSEVGLSMHEANQMTAWFFLLVLIGRILFILMRPKLSIVYQLMISIFLTVLAVFAGIFITPWALILSGLLLSPFYPMAMAYSGEEFKSNLPTVTGFAVTATSVAIVLMHLTTGLLSDWMGIRIAFMMCAFFGLVSFSILIWLKRHE
jgi:fucose permease